MLEQVNLSSDYTSSLVLIEEGKPYVKSEAALRLVKHFNGLWKLGSILFIFPEFIRNPVYSLIARNRYKWFGKKDACWIPEPKWKARFLD
jgi:predicted DCC family thiol-disulfide oxidoreductase YuxK